MDKKAKAPTRFRIRVTSGQYANLYVSSISGVPLGAHGGTKYFLNPEQGAAFEFFEYAPVLTALLAKLTADKIPTQVDEVP
jgi:hypothetical protein